MDLESYSETQNFLQQEDGLYLHPEPGSVSSPVKQSVTTTLSVHVPPGCSLLEIVYEGDSPPQLAFRTKTSTRTGKSAKYVPKESRSSRIRKPYHPAEKNYIISRFRYYQRNDPQMRINQIASAIWKDLQTHFYPTRELARTNGRTATKICSQRSIKSICTLLYNYRASL